MLLDSTAAKALFAVILTSAQGADCLKRQMPLKVEDRASLWLVTGTPFTDLEWQIRFTMFSMFFDKQSAEVKGLQSHGRIIPTEEDKAYWATIMTPEQYKSALEPPTHFEPSGIDEIWPVIYGGVVPTAECAVDYATVLMHTKTAWSHVSPSDLVATERDGVWHIGGRHAGTYDLVTLSKKTGKLLSGDL